MTQACNEQTCFLSSGEKDFSIGPYCEFDNIAINCVALTQFHIYVGLFMINEKKKTFILILFGKYEDTYRELPDCHPFDSFIYV